MGSIVFILFHKDLALFISPEKPLSLLFVSLSKVQQSFDIYFILENLYSQGLLNSFYGLHFK